jgi:cytoskeletal protein RodZ
MRNFIYNKSDIMVAIGIVLVAAILIITRVNAIMDYPKDNTTDSENQTSSADLSDLNGESKESDKTESDTSEKDSDNSADSDSDTKNDNSSETGDVEFTIEIGQPTATTAAELEAVGLIPNADAFITAVQAKNAETSIQAGTFTIPKGSTIDEIIIILSN